jgi:hypothetical protein
MIKATITEEADKEERLNHTQNPSPDGTLLAHIEETWTNAKTTTSIELHLKHDEKKADILVSEHVPKEYHEYLDVFDEVKADRFPESRPWDHKIELKEGFQPKLCKSYNLTPEEQIELDKWTKDNLEKGYIRPSQSPMASPFFYVKKKDGKLRPARTIYISTAP